MINFKPLISNYEYFQIVKPLGKSIHLKAGETIKAEVIDILPTGGVVLKMKGGILTVETDIPLQKDTSLLLKILNTPSTEHKLKIQVIGIFDKKNNVQLFNIKQSQIDEILNLISSIPSFKKNLMNTLSSIIRESSYLNTDNMPFIFKLFSSILKQEKIHNMINESTLIRNLIPHINNIDLSKFHILIKNSGIFFESKIKNRNLDKLNSDVKGILLSKKENLSLEENHFLKVIENYQLLSKLTGGIFTYIPVIWENLERGDIFIKKSNKGKNVYFCKIDLDFKHLGKLNTGIFLFGKELYINTYVENDKFRNVLRKGFPELSKTLKTYGFKEVSFKMLKDFPEEMKFIDENFLRLKA